MDHLITARESTHRNTKDIQRNEVQKSSMFLEIPDLGPHRSLHRLIEDDLESQENGSIEMARLLRQSEEAAESDAVTIQAVASEITDEGTGVEAGNPANSTDYDERRGGFKMEEARTSTNSAHVSLWQRLFPRRRAISEQPKVVYSQKRRHILREVILVHFLPVSINFALLALYVRQVLWTPPLPTTNVLNALQFAAKVHESLMIASLVTILLHHIRYRLLSSNHSSSGLPLGLITSPFRLLDITYIWSKEFSAVCRHRKGHRVSEALTIIVHVYIFILAAILGPASAISILPKLGVWELASTIANAPFYNPQHRNGSYQAYIGASMSQIFPEAVTADLIPRACDYSNLSSPQTNTCARLGLMDIVQGMYPPEQSGKLGFRPYNSSDDNQDVTFPSYNITVQAHNDATLPARIMKVSEPYLPGLYTEPSDDIVPSFGVAVDATTPTDAILHLTETLIGYYINSWTLTALDDNLFEDYLSTGAWTTEFTPYAGQRQESTIASSSWKQPYVSSFCSRLEYGTETPGPLHFKFGSGSVQPLYTVTLDANYLFTRVNQTGMGFLDITEVDITPSYTPSATFAFVSQSYTTLCLVKANWVDFTLSGSYSSSYWEDYPDRLSWTYKAAASMDLAYYTNETWFTNTDFTENIHLDLDWLTVLDLGTGNSQTMNYSFYKKVREVCLGTSALDSEAPHQFEQHPDPPCMAAGLALGIAEGLSKTLYNFDIHFLGSTGNAASGHPDSSRTLSPWTYTGAKFSQRLVLPGNWSLSNITLPELPADFTRFDFRITQRLYGYNFHDVTIILAFTVLFLYVATVFIHILVLMFGTNWNSKFWKSPGEFFVLALKSPIPDTVLDNTGGGVETSATWRARASVQELPDSRVGVVIANQDQLDTDVGKSSAVRPDWKYS